MLQIALCRHLRGVEITGADARACNMDLTAVTLPYRLALLIQQVNRRIRNGYAEVAVAVSTLEGTAGGKDRGFGRAINIVQRTVPDQLFNHVGLTHIPARDQMLHAKQRLERDDTQQRRRQERMGDVLLLNQLGQRDWVATLVFGWHYQLGALDQGRENIQQRRIEVDGGELQRTAAFIQLHITGVPGAEVAQVLDRQQHAFRLPGGAGGVDRYARCGARQFHPLQALVGSEGNAAITLGAMMQEIQMADVQGSQAR